MGEHRTCIVLWGWTQIVRGKKTAVPTTSFFLLYLMCLTHQYVQNSRVQRIFIKYFYKDHFTSEIHVVFKYTNQSEVTPLLYLSCDRGELLKWLFPWAKRQKIHLVYSISLPLSLGDNCLLSSPLLTHCLLLSDCSADSSLIAHRAPELSCVLSSTLSFS